MPNQRIIFSSQCVALAPDGSTTFVELHGVQSVGMTTNFTLTQVFELSNSSIYENIEGTPDVQISLQKVLDGYPPAYLQATRGASARTSVARSAQKCIFGLAVHDDTVSAASGVPVREVICSGAVVGSVSYNFPVEGFFTEDITLLCTDKVWRSGSFYLQGYTSFINDAPLSLGGSSGGVNQREDILWTSPRLTGVIGRDSNGAVSTDYVTILPNEVDGISSSGLNNRLANGNYQASVQNISTSIDFGRREIFQLGKRTYFARFANPFNEVNTSITTLGTYWDNISANEDGVRGDGNNLADQTIKIRLREGLLIDLGTKNKLASVDYGGGDAGGEEVQITYNYQNFNDFTVGHTNDPTVALRIDGPIS